MNDDLGLDDLVSRRVADQLGERLPAKAILIVETIHAEGQGIRFFTSEAMTWQALGMIRSIQLRLEHEDTAAWPDQ